LPGWRRRGGFAAALEIMSLRSVELSPESRTIVLSVVEVHAVPFVHIHISIERPLTRHCSFSLEAIVVQHWLLYCNTNIGAREKAETNTIFRFEAL
jgi:hypothetical protein